MGNATNVIIGAKAVKYAEYPEAMPTITTEVTWGENWNDFPFITNAGVKASFFLETRSVEAFMQDAPIKEGIVKTGAKSIEISLLESDTNALAFAFPATEETAEGWLTHGNLTAPKQYAIGIETEIGVRLFPRVQAAGEPEMVFAGDEENVIAVTFNCLVDANGKSWYAQDFTAGT